jgi:glycosyltransferase involved in cell wall biosynthesis
MASLPHKIAFVIPWFGNHTGGAEVFCKGLALALKGVGKDVTVLTTCCRDPFHDWGANHLPAGESDVDGIRVLRFPVVRGNSQLYGQYHQVVAGGGDLSEDQEVEMLANGIHSDELCAHISANSSEYLFFFLPYLYGTTWFGMRAADPDHAFLIPCLHNEPFAYMVAMQQLFHRARGCLFLSQPERDFASALFDLTGKPQCLLGGGVSREVAGNAERFRARHGVKGPFALFVGRKVPGKGADMLAKYFGDYLALNPQEEAGLVMIGKGDLEIPADLRGRIVEPDTPTPEDVFDAMAACEFLVQPSFFESFSLVLMEAWMNRKPALVNGECEVIRHHVLESNGGLFFSSFGEFAEAFRFLRRNPAACAAMGSAGEHYVRSNYLWHDTALRFQGFVANIGRQDAALAS